MRWQLASVLLVGCGGSHGPAVTVTVSALAGDQPEAGATVIGHRADGMVLDTVTADATGRADVGSEDGALVSVVFPALDGTATPNPSMVTTLAPNVGDTLVVHGPAHDATPPIIVGGLDVKPQRMLNAATRFTVDLGCIVVPEPALPAVIDVGARCEGSDTNIDVLVRGYDASDTIVGYAAGRVAMIDGAGTFDPASWTPAGTPVAVQLDGVAPGLDWVLWVDGLPFAAEPIANPATLWTGLAVDGATVHATIPAPNGARITTLAIAGGPSAIQLGTGDFLPAIDGSLSMTGLSLAWAAAGVGGDVVDVRLQWDSASAVVPPGPHHVVWDVVLPPDATAATFPAVDGDLATLFALPAGVTPDVVLRYLDSPDVDGFAALAAAGLHVEDLAQPATIVEPPTAGVVRETRVLGVAR